MTLDMRQPRERQVLFFSQRSCERQDDCTRRFAGMLRFLQLDRDLIPTIRDI
jgi:hypothetical protein